ncbi:LysM peptidoglycan-binding domain-containing protein [Teratosphaeria destructans]|uniref:LysM peptidoglycan-binding domain-containing protein n=1 Tax=Teratosphaeria destructans TaxID=418781 RepID=A0A9W7SU38_9PEZI|nr:LysM peptidoglycan-binding domain-containing protein [Teratosphaeria destructans]
MQDDPDTSIIEEPIRTTPAIKEPIRTTPAIKDPLRTTPAIKDPLRTTPAIKDPLSGSQTHRAVRVANHGTIWFLMNDRTRSARRRRRDEAKCSPCRPR